MKLPGASRSKSKRSPYSAGRQLGQRILQTVSDEEELNEGSGSKAWGKESRENVVGKQTGNGLRGQERKE